MTWLRFPRLLEIFIGGPAVYRIEKALCDRRIGIDAAVAQEGPVAPCFFNQVQVDLAQQDFLSIVRRLRDDAPKRIGQKAMKTAWDQRVLTPWWVHSR